MASPSRFSQSQQRLRSIISVKNETWKESRSVVPQPGQAIMGKMPMKDPGHSTLSSTMMHTARVRCLEPRAHRSETTGRRMATKSCFHPPFHPGMVSQPLDRMYEYLLRTTRCRARTIPPGHTRIDIPFCQHMLLKVIRRRHHDTIRRQEHILNPPAGLPTVAHQGFPQ
jgi:hypothetical protein